MDHPTRRKTRAFNQQDWCQVTMVAFTAVFITSHYATDAVIRRYICGLMNDAA